MSSDINQGSVDTENMIQSENLISTEYTPSFIENVKNFILGHPIYIMWIFINI